MSQTATATESPCIRICQIDDEGICIGCLRSLDEIAAWPQMDREARSRLLAELERRRVTPAA